MEPESKVLVEEQVMLGTFVVCLKTKVSAWLADQSQITVTFFVVLEVSG
jgi:hypothetical protein